MERKRVRSANFTPEEKHLCLSLIENHKEILDIKKTNAATWREKEEVWRKIETTFNSQCPAGIKRTKESLKKFYDNTKKANRKMAVKEKYLATLGRGSISETITIIPTFELEVPSSHKKPTVRIKHEFDDDTRNSSSLSKEEITLPCDIEDDERSSPENFAVKFDNEVLYAQKDLDLNCLSAEDSIEENNLPVTFKKKEKYGQTKWATRRRTNVSTTNTLAKKYEELATVKIKCSNIQLVILEIEKESAQLKLERERKELESKNEEDRRNKEDYKRSQREHEMQKEREDQLFNLKRQSLLLDIQIKKCQLQTLNCI